MSTNQEADQAGNEERIDAVTREQELEQELDRLHSARALNRRRFLAGLGVAAGASVLAGCGGSSSSKGPVVVGATGPAEVDVLTFALNLEYLEASFYLYATTGAGLSAADLGILPGTPIIGPGPVTGGSKVPFSTPQIADIAAQIANDEKAHVELLRNALSALLTPNGATTPVLAIPCPTINLAARGFGFATQSDFLVLARQLEDVGVSAYAGMATMLSGTNLLLSGANLQGVAQLLAVEAFHASFLRLSMIQQNITINSNPNFLAVDTLDVLPSESSFFTEKSGLVVTRTPSQVLQFLYADPPSAGTTIGTGVTRGGFFPSGVNTISGSSGGIVST